MGLKDWFKIRLSVTPTFLKSNNVVITLLVGTSIKN